MTRKLPDCFSNPPFVPESHIERRAMGCLATYATKSSKQIAFPVPIEDVLEFAFNISPVYKPDSFFDAADGGILGAYCFTCDTMYVNEEGIGYVPRLRWTLAHEFGHYVLHRGMTRQMSLFGTGDEPLLYAYRGALTSSDRLEIQANLFASHILLPNELVRAFMSAPGRLEAPDLARALSEEAHVSLQAAGIRLARLLPASQQSTPLL